MIIINAILWIGEHCIILSATPTHQTLPKNTVKTPLTNASPIAYIYR